MAAWYDDIIDTNKVIDERSPEEIIDTIKNKIANMN